MVRRVRRGDGHGQPWPHHQHHHPPLQRWRHFLRKFQKWPTGGQQHYRPPLQPWRHFLRKFQKWSPAGLSPVADAFCVVDIWPTHFLFFVFYCNRMKTVLAMHIVTMLVKISKKTFSERKRKNILNYLRVDQTDTATMPCECFLVEFWYFLTFTNVLYKLCSFRIELWI